MRILGALSNLEFLRGENPNLGDLGRFLLPASISIGKDHLAARLATLNVREALTTPVTRALCLALCGYAVLGEGDSLRLVWGLFDTRRERSRTGSRT